MSEPWINHFALGETFCQGCGNWVTGDHDQHACEHRSDAALATEPDPDDPVAQAFRAAIALTCTGQIGREAGTGTTAGEWRNQ